MTGPEGNAEFVTAAQVLWRLAEIEQDGVEFYQGLLEGTTSEWIKKFATLLMKAEMRHKRRFTEYAQAAEKSASAEGNTLTQTLPPEVTRLLSLRVLARKERVKASAPYANPDQAVKLAIRAEENIALLLTQLHQYVPRAQRPYIARVIREEWKHKSFLEDLYRKEFGTIHPAGS